MNKKIRNQKGITLIALVITIIILLILAGISIASLTGSGLFERSKEAKNKSEEAQNLENLRLSEYEKIIEDEIPVEKNSIEILMRYAGIDSNKYNSIDEILNDEEALQKLMDSERAIKYMQESDIILHDIKNSQALKNKVTPLTSDVGGECKTYSSSYLVSGSGNYIPYFAFNGEIPNRGYANLWCPGNGELTENTYITYYKPEGIIPIEIHIYHGSPSGSATWTAKFKGSNTNNDDDWEDISDEFTISYSNEEVKTEPDLLKVNINKTKKYKYIKLQFTGGDTYTSTGTYGFYCYEMKIFGL